MKVFTLTQTSKYVYKDIPCDVYTYKNGENIVKFFLHPTEAFSVMFMSATNVTARVRNKVADAFIAAGMGKKDADFNKRVANLQI